MLDPNHDGEVTPEECENFIDKAFELIINRREEMKLYFQLSIQPEVLNFLEHKYVLESQERREFIVNYFADKLPIANKQYAYFSVMAFFKGLGMVATYTESIYSTDFLMGYKEFLKKIILK
jgi:hypothetical protein